MTELQEKLESAFIAASRKIGGLPGTEGVYANAYQALVQAGFRRQIRRKYRGC